MEGKVLKMEPCCYCGREQDECICELAPDFPEDEDLYLDTDYLSWDYVERPEEDYNEGDWEEDLGRTIPD